MTQPIRKAIIPHTYNIVACDCTVNLASLMVGIDIDFSQIFIEEIHERAFQMTTTLPFLCLIFHFCREATVFVGI